MGDLPQTRLTYAGRAPDAAWRQRAEKRIRQHRQGDFTLQIIDSAGQPVADAPVKVTMQRHAFLFGSALQMWRLTSETAEIRPIAPRSKNSSTPPPTKTPSNGRLGMATGARPISAAQRRWPALLGSKPMIFTGAGTSWSGLAGAISPKASVIWPIKPTQPRLFPTRHRPYRRNHPSHRGTSRGVGRHQRAVHQPRPHGSQRRPRHG